MRKLLAIMLMLLSVPAIAEIYKYVDEDGAVVYTDKKPTDDAQPVELPGLTVMDAPKPPPARIDSGSGEDETEPERVFGDLTMLSPRRDETFQGTGNTVPVRLAARQALRPGDQVHVLLDGQEQGSFSTMTINLQQVPRGTHEVRAQVKNAAGQVIGDTGPVTFHMKQHSQLHRNQPMVTPPPGGSGQ